MTAHYTRDHIRENSQIRMPITTSTDSEIIEVPVGNIINIFNLGSKLVDITSDGRTNRARCKAILDIPFENTGLFDLENTMCMME